MKQEKRISYQAGITRRPSDFLCKDGDLAECINLTTDSEELKPVVQPSEFMDMNKFNVGKIVFVHSSGDEKRYIALNLTSGFMWGTRNEQTGEFERGTENVIPLPGQSGFKFTAVGKTLIVSDDAGVHYYLWKPSGEENGYKQLPDAIPDPVFTPYIGSSARGGQAGVPTDYLDVVCNSGKYLGCIGGSFPRPQITDQEAFNDLVVGLYSKNKRQIAKKKGFCTPFFVRAAVELRNGEYTKITNPVLLFPCVRENSWATYIDMVDNVLMYTQYAWLKFSQETDYSEWSDIVKGVTLFISDGVEVHDLVEDQSNRAIQDDTQDLDFVSTSLTSMVESNTSSYYNYEPHVTATGGLSLYSYYVLNRRDPQDIVNDIESSSIFYKLCDIGLKPITKQNVASYVKSNVLENLVNQQQLKVDDYYSRSRFNAEVIHAYNSRLHMANVKRSFFEGFDYFLPMDGGSADYTFYVTINTDKGKITVKHGPITTTQRQGNYFYYPDARAEKVVIVKNGSVICVRNLKEHSGLNGAYFLRGLPGTSPNVGGVVYQWDQDISDTGTAPTPSTDPTDDFPNYIIVSEVNNPFVFRSTGYHSIGNGVVVGMATQAQALGQEEHGIHPLIVFTDRGLVTLKVGNDGQYTNRVDEMPREVCINPACITETDGAVFFVSKKGLMVIVGNQASCVSENLNGHPFDIADLPGLEAASLADQTLATAPWAEIITACQGTETDHTTVNGFLEFIRSENCRIAYDYVDKRLLIVNPDFGFAYVYGMADGSICKTVLPAVIDNVVNDYPDNLLQGGAGGTVYSLYDKPREDEVDNLQTAFLLTRPMKLGGPLTVSSLRELVNVGFWDKEVVQAPLPVNSGTEANEAPAPGTETETPEENEAETPISSETEGAEETSEDAEEPGVTPEETPTEISCVKSMVWVSDNLKKWYLMSSRFGAAAKYFRLGLFIKMLPTERLSGTIITEQERRTNNLRA